jgi:hypothetical protein
VQEKVEVKWRPIRANDRVRKEAADNGNLTYALHLEASTEKAVMIRQKLTKWYGPGKKAFPDGSKM